MIDGDSLAATAIIPVVVGICAVVELAWAWWRSRRRISTLLAIVAAVGVVGGAAYLNRGAEYLSGDLAPIAIWLAVTGAALGVTVANAVTRRWWPTFWSLGALSLSLLMVASGLNVATGMFPTVTSMFNRLTHQPIAGQLTLDAALAQRRRHSVPPSSVLLALGTPQNEYAIVPPKWFSGERNLSAVMLLGGALSTPADWVTVGGAVQVSQQYAHTHGGNAPVLILPSASGSFFEEPDCATNADGSASQRLSAMRSKVITELGVARSSARWGIAGWSLGADCAVTLTDSSRGYSRYLAISPSVIKVGRTSRGIAVDDAASHSWQYARAALQRYFPTLAESLNPSSP